MDQVTISRELLRQVIDSLEATCGHRCNAEYNPCHEQELVWQLRTALEQPAVEQEPIGEIVACDDHGHPWKRIEYRFPSDIADLPIGTKVYVAPQAQQPRIGTGTSVEQTLEQWEHDFRNPMTPEQQADWVKREREFAARQAQQPRKAVKLTDEELVDHYCAIADGKEWAIGGLSDAVPFARAIEQAVWEKLGVIT